MSAFRRAAAGKSVEWKGKCLMKKLFALGMASVMALSLAACGGSASSAASGAADTSSAATAEATGKKWVVATDTVFKPFEYTDASGNFVGIDVDILAAIAEDQGFEYELKSLGWDAAIAACQSGQADAMIAGASITDERKASGWMFSDGYYDSNQTPTLPALPTCPARMLPSRPARRARPTPRASRTSTASPLPTLRIPPRCIRPFWAVSASAALRIPPS